MNTSATTLIRQLLKNGIPSHFLLTDANPINFVPLSIPSDILIERLPVKPEDSWQTCWETLIDYLEEKAPCIYLPGYDWEYSCISPGLSSRVGIVGVLHSDEKPYYDSVRSLGRYWNSIIAVSETISQKALEVDETIEEKLTVIPYGVPVDSFPNRKYEPDTPLKIIYTGRIIQKQKRILDLLKIVDVLVKKKIPFYLTLIGEGPECGSMMKAWKSLIELKVIKFLGTLSCSEIIKELETHDVFILTSEYEGLPVSLLEAMSRGCIPVVTDIRSGIPEVVCHGVNGYRVPIGDILQFSEYLSVLQSNGKLCREMSLKSYRIMKKGGFNIENIAQRYIKVFNQVIESMEDGAYSRPKGEILPPYFLDVSPFHHKQIQNTYAHFRKIWPLLGHPKFLRFAQWLTKFPFIIRLLSTVLTNIERPIRWAFQHRT